ncbi:MAG: type I-E CRISPR-associated protein Cse1/CasA [Bacillota bacterium]
MARFNVLYERWIPVEDQTGRVEELSLLEVLERAENPRVTGSGRPALVAINDPAPPIQFGLYRLLIAFIQDALPVRTVADLTNLYKQGRFDMAAVERYVAEVGERRFDLFDPEWPFLQSPPGPDDAKSTVSVANLFFHLPTGTNVIHFHHAYEDGQAIAPAVCARALTAIAPFMTAGGRGYSPSVNGSPPWYVLVRGETLFETLLLNCCVVPLGLPGDTPVAWRSREPVVPGQERPCRSLGEGFTWQPRRVRLIPGEGGRCTYSGVESPVLVREIVYGPGYKHAEGDGWIDPNVAYVESDRRQPLRPREDRDLWRDIGPLMLLRKEDYRTEDGRISYSRPLVVTQVRRLKEERRIPRTTHEVVEVYGMRVDKAKVFEWQCERLALPEAVAALPDAGRQVQRALETAERLAGGLRSALKLAYPRGGKSNQRAFERLIQTAVAAYWAELHDEFRTFYIPALAALDPGDLDARARLAAQWLDRAQAAGSRALEMALDSLDSDADALARQVQARQHFRRVVAGLRGEGAGKERRRGERRQRRG